MSVLSDYTFLALHAYSPHNHGRFDDVLDAYQREREACQKIDDAVARTRSAAALRKAQQVAS